MGAKKKNYTVIKLIGLCLLSTLVISASAFGKDSSKSSNAGVFFKTGKRSPIGHISTVLGDAVIHHDGEKLGYWVRKGYPLYLRDRITTKDNGRLWIKFNDGSVITFEPDTEMVLTEASYSKKKKSRKSFINFIFGKARFVVKKYRRYKISSFFVKTPTVVMGVRGSDFIVKATPEFTNVVILENTRLEVVSVETPDMEPILLTSFERVDVKKGIPPSKVEKISRQDAAQYTKELSIPPELIEHEDSSSGLSESDSGQDTIKEEKFPFKEILREWSSEKRPDDRKNKDFKKQETPNRNSITRTVNGTGNYEVIEEEISQTKGIEEQQVKKQTDVKVDGSGTPKIIIGFFIILGIGVVIFYFLANKMRTKEHGSQREQGLEEEEDSEKITESGFIEVLSNNWKVLMAAQKEGEDDEVEKVFKETFAFIQTVKQRLEDDDFSGNYDDFKETIKIFEGRWENLEKRIIQENLS